MMLNLLRTMLVAVPLVFALGCGESRPDPRDNPDFDEEAYNDPNVIPGAEEGSTSLMPPSVLFAPTLR